MLFATLHGVGGLAADEGSNIDVFIAFAFGIRIGHLDVFAAVE